MEFVQQMDMTQKQTLIISEEMKIALNILALPAMELNDYLNEIVSSNPTLELEPNSLEGYGQGGLNERNIVDYLNYLDDSDRNEPTEYDDSERRDDLSRILSEEKDLKSYLLEQVNLSQMGGAQRRILEFLIEQLDENGYFPNNLEEISDRFRIPKNDLLRMLYVLQSFEPFGVGARNLKECLAIQLSMTGKGNWITRKIIEEHLEDVANNSIAKISRKLNIGMQEVLLAIKEIKALEPKPGRAFQPNEEPVFILAELIVEEKDSGLQVAYRDHTIPTLKISSYYRSLLEHNEDTEVKDYILRKLKKGFWIIKCIEQRKETILRMMDQILIHQHDFFAYGAGHMRYLTQQQVADELNVSPSTISRAIKDKYVQTMWGIFPLSCFFKSGNYFKEKTEVSEGSIIAMINQIIEKEDKDEPLSDQMICELLKKNNIHIARRTVAKYRDALHVPNALKRKNYERFAVEM